MRFGKIFLLFVILLGCVEPYDFHVTDADPSVVIEAFISDKSFNETKAYPSDGRHFIVKLSYTSDVINTNGTVISGAEVNLINSLGQQWTYQETEQGLYSLLDDNFKAEPNIQYKLQVILDDQNIFESAWAEMPVVNTPVMGTIGFREAEEKMYKYESNEKVVRWVKGIFSTIELPPNKTQQDLHYEWQFTPAWIYISPLGRDKCWAVNPLYLRDNTLHLDRVGGYEKDLFFIETIRNERIFEKLSVLVTQYTLTEDFYFFKKEMQDQVNNGSVFDKPPYNLRTNFHTTEGEKKVMGHFGVVREQAQRWYFNTKDLSYYVENTLLGDCLVDYGPGGPAPECLRCIEYSNGIASDEKPSWWTD